MQQGDEGSWELRETKFVFLWTIPAQLYSVGDLGEYEDIKQYAKHELNSQNNIVVRIKTISSTRI